MKSIGLIALDLDGTLLDSRKRLSSRSKEALIRCARMEIQIVPITGRAMDDIMGEIRMLPGVNYAIIANGGMAADLENTRRLFRRTLTNEKTLEILSIVDKYNVTYDPYTNGRGITQPEFIDYMGNYGVSPTIQKTVRAARDAVLNAIRYIKKCGSGAEKASIYLGDLEERKTLREGLGPVEGIVISSFPYNNLEINAYGAIKGNALMWLTDYLSISKKATMASGDGEDDIFMIEAAGAGVVMRNGLEAAKTAADEITLTNDEDGVAAVIERLIINRS